MPDNIGHNFLMRWNKETVEERFARLTEWHEWFAWRPVRVHTWNVRDKCSIETRNIIWLENVQRRFLASQADANIGRSNSKIYMDKEDALIEKLVREENKEDREATMARFKTYMNKRTIRE